MMSPRTLLDLGRVSNLPTVWTNVLAGAALSGGPLTPAPLVVLGVAASLLYLGGMFLNDAFDRDFDRRLRPERPIPRGRATPAHVFGAGFLLLAAGVMLIFVRARPLAQSAAPGASAWAPVAAAATLAALIVAYDAFHKATPLGVGLMGLCRAGLYVLAAAAIGSLTRGVALGALLLFLYVVGLSLVARREAEHPGLRGVVGRLIAGICLLDALLVGATGAWAAAALAALGFPLTLAGQRYVKGT